MGAVRLHCQTMAFVTGIPLFLSQTMVVSRWLVIPTAAMCSAETPSWLIASAATLIWEDQICVGSCSTQPGFGKICGNSRCAMLQIFPFWSNRIHRELVVPWSSAIIYF